jgi:hypothetical protein
MTQEPKLGDRRPRFALKLPVWYRTGADQDWRCSMTQNISCSGAAIDTTKFVPAGTLVTVKISLPPVGSGAGSCLTATGEVVRPIEASSSALTGFAMSVTRYRIERRANLPQA